MKLEIRFIIQLGMICNCDFVVWPLCFVDVDRVSVDRNEGLVRCTMVMAKTILRHVNRLCLIGSSCVLLEFFLST